MDIEYLESEIISFKNGKVEQFEIRVKWQNEYAKGSISGFGLTVEQAITDLCDSVQKSVQINESGIENF